jgi:ankyrin repeat protein
MGRTRALARFIVAAAIAAAAACGPKDPREVLAKKGVPFSADAFVAQARAGDDKTVRLFLAAGMAADSRAADGTTALVGAADNNRIEVVKALIEGGADLKAERPVPDLPLMRAIRAGHTDLAVLLLDKGAHSYVQDDLWTPLMLASFLGDERTAKTVITHKPDINAKNDRGLTALMFAAIGGHANVARLLVDNGATVDAEDAGGHTPLMFAANNGYKDVVELLLAHHADPKHANRAKATAATLAAGNGHGDIVTLLGGAAAGVAPAALPARAADASAADGQTFAQAAEAAWQYVERNYRPSTGLIDSTAAYPYTTVWDIGSDIGALYAGHELKYIGDAEYDRRMRRLLGTLASVKLYDNAAFNKVYSTRTGAMITRGDQSSAHGYGWSAIDIGRLLVWLKILAVNEPAYAADAEKVVRRLAMDRLVAGGYLRGEDLDHSGAPRRYQEGRIGYEQYAAAGFAAWGAKPDKALRLAENRLPLKVMGREMPADIRGGDRITSDPLILMGLELGWDPEMEKFAAAFLASQEARYRQTGRVTLAAEDAISRPPYFFYYYCAFANGKAFGLDVQDPRGAVEQPRWVSSKAAFAWHALRPSAYTELALRTVAPARTPAGWGAGVYEGSGGSTGTLNVNTAAVILTSALFQSRGTPLLQAGGRK